MLTIPSSAPAAKALADTVLSVALSADTIELGVRQISQEVLAHSRYLRSADFKAIHPGDLEFLFTAYDKRFFSGLCQRALDGTSLDFLLSPRMTRTGGKTTKFRMASGDAKYAITIASSMLFDGFGEADRSVTVCGLECENRLEALQRIFEHELVHLAELLSWGKSNCSAPQFQGIASRLFRHQAHTHNLVTRGERAAGLGIRVGALVRFVFEGRQYTGRVNRITKRASVLVQDPNGQRYTDGFMYKTYYVPIGCLELADGRNGGGR